MELNGMQMRTQMGTKVLLSFLVLLFFNVSVALGFDVPDSIQKLLRDRGRQDLIEQFLAIPSVSPEQFVSAISEQGTLSLVGSGYNGVTFKDKLKRLSKVSYAVFLAHPETKERWGALHSLNGVPDLSEAAAAPDRKINSFAVEKELMGTLLWSAYFPKAATRFPDLVSTDGRAYRRPYVEGIALNTVLDAQRSKKPSELKKYNKQKLWERINEVLNLGEKMLLETGMMVDLVNPANFIVTGTYDDPKLDVIDNELLRPSTEALAVYVKEKGVQIPDAEYAQGRDFIQWPLMPDHIVFTTLWGMNFTQALDFLQVRYKINRTEAIKKLASIPEWPIEMAPKLQDYDRIQRAKMIACESLLK